MARGLCVTGTEQQLLLGPYTLPLHTHRPRPSLTPQMSKAPIQAFADRVSAVFVPVIVALALLTWAVW